MQGKAGKPTKFQATSSTQEASTSRNSTITRTITRTRGKETMGVGGSVYTHMPTKKVSILRSHTKRRTKGRALRRTRRLSSIHKKVTINDCLWFSD